VSEGDLKVWDRLLYRCGPAAESFDLQMSCLLEQLCMFYVADIDLSTWVQVMIVVVMTMMMMLMMFLCEGQELGDSGSQSCTCRPVPSYRTAHHGPQKCGNEAATLGPGSG